MRQLSERMKGHHLAALPIGMVKYCIFQHLVDHDHHVNLNQAFIAVHQIPSYLPRDVRLRLLLSAESIPIRIYKPDLCKPKQLSQTLHLPWPSNFTKSHYILLSL